MNRNSNLTAVSKKPTVQHHEFISVKKISTLGFFFINQTQRIWHHIRRDIRFESRQIWFPLCQVHRGYKN
jgi:hypothetical protein